MEKDTIFSGIERLRDPRSLRIKETLKAVADLGTTLFLFGETGVGKDFWVHYLYHIGSLKTILNLNCGDVPENLLESEWFGYKRGAFTGADRDYDGKWRKAEGGILFLNQIDLLSLNLQARLLRIIDRKRYFPLGSNEEREVNVRFVFAADHDIEEKVRHGEFRQDLFYRISAYAIQVPPLRERRKDILPLVRHFAAEKGVAVRLGPEGRKALTGYPWRGNIREIENFINGISIRGGELTDEQALGLDFSTPEWLETRRVEEMPLAELEREYILYLVRRYRSRVKVARILGISRKSLYNKLKKYGGH